MQGLIYVYVCFNVLKIVFFILPLRDAAFFKSSSLAFCSISILPAKLLNEWSSCAIKPLKNFHKEQSVGYQITAFQNSTVLHKQWVYFTHSGEKRILNLVGKDKIWGRRRKQLLNDFKEKRRYRRSKDGALECNWWRTRFGRGYGPAVRQTAWWQKWDVKYQRRKAKMLRWLWHVTRNSPVFYPEGHTQ
jgi:hypothetical protein